MAFVEGVFPFSSREIVVYRKISGERQKRRNVSHTYPSRWLYEYDWSTVTDGIAVSAINPRLDPTGR
jgi:hypothetical protein